MLKEFRDFLFRGNFFIVKPVQAMLARFRPPPIEEGMPDEEGRHQKLLAALQGTGT